MLIVGGTGFVGSCLSDVLKSKKDSITLSSRGASLSDQPRNSGSTFRHVVWDVVTESQLDPNFDIIIHAATPASALLNSTQPKVMFDQNVLAMQNVIDFVGKHKSPPIVLFPSSGAVYGDMPDGLDRIPEDWTRPNFSTPLISAYAEGKIAAETMLREATQAGKCVGLIARLFAFSGIHLPVDKHFAIGNFIRDVVDSQLITIRSDGSSVRSYMDGHDLANWLLRIIEVGSPEVTYHVGSERSISIYELAVLVAERYELCTNQSVQVEILGQSSPMDGVSRYVPSTHRTRQFLSLTETIKLESSIDQMIQYQLQIKKIRRNRSTYC